MAPVATSTQAAPSQTLPKIFKPSGKLDRGQAIHPLDPLSVAEIQITGQTVKQHALQSDFGIKSINFNAITLLEPEKSKVLRALGIPLEPLQFGQAPPPPSEEVIHREAYAILLDHSSGRSYEATVNLSQSNKVTSFTQLAEDIQPCVTIQELLDAEPIVKGDPEIQRLCKEIGLTMDQVFCDGWSIGNDARWPITMRVQQCLMFARPHGPDSNLYAHPLDFIPIIDMNASKVAHIDWICPKLPGVEQTTVPPPLADAAGPTWKRTGYPDTPSEYLPEYIDKTENGTFKMRTDLKPIHITQPEGVSFTLNGNNLKWQKYSMHIGFNYREGLVINTLTYKDTDAPGVTGDTIRPLIYRMSIAEMVVPYGEPAFSHHRKMAFDAGEYGLGFMANSLSLGCDCKGSIAYLDAQFATFSGGAQTTKNAICIHEEDAGLAWKHTDYRTGRAHSVRMRKLVVSCVCTLANYEYGFYFNFFQDGSVQSEVKLTGILNTAHLGEGEKPGAFGTEVAPRVNAHFHQHVFCLRVDPMIDGLQNSLVQTDVKVLGTPTGHSTNYLGNAFTVQKTTLDTAQHADYSINTARSWTITNPSRKHYSSNNDVGYKIVCKDFAPLFAAKDSIVAHRAPFATHHVWVVPYQDDKRYPAGMHLPQATKALDGINSWVAKEGRTENTDIVTYITFATTHIPRPEDFPVMPVDAVGVTLKPNNFFRRNPALDVPQESDATSVHATLYTEERQATNGHVSNGHGELNGSGCH